MKGILFKPYNIKATIEGTKTQTRRVIKPQPTKAHAIKLNGFWAFDKDDKNIDVEVEFRKPRYQVGEVVYIKEAYYQPIDGYTDENGDWRSVKITDKTLRRYIDEVESGWKYEPYRHCLVKVSPLFMAADFARYFITIEDVRAERLQEITFDDCLAEGIAMQEYIDYKPETNFGIELKEAQTSIFYAQLWDSINKPPYDWNSNPWVFVYTYSPISPRSQGLF